MRNDYRFEVYTDCSDTGEKVYVVKYYDFETVIGVGDTINEAIEEAQENLDVFLKYCGENNITVPIPSLHEENDYSGKVTLRMSKNLHKLVDERAKEEGISINLLLNEAIAEYVSKENSTKKIMEEFSNEIKNAIQEAFDSYECSFNYGNQLELWQKVLFITKKCYEC